MAILNKVARERFTDIFEQRLEGDEDLNHVVIWCQYSGQREQLSAKAPRWKQPGIAQ